MSSQEFIYSTFRRSNKLKKGSDNIPLQQSSKTKSEVDFDKLLLKEDTLKISLTPTRINQIGSKSNKLKPRIESPFVSKHLKEASSEEDGEDDDLLMPGQLNKKGKRETMWEFLKQTDQEPEKKENKGPENTQSPNSAFQASTINRSVNKTTKPLPRLQARIESPFGQKDPNISEEEGDDDLLMPGQIKKITRKETFFEFLADLDDEAPPEIKPIPTRRKTPTPSRIHLLPPSKPEIPEIVSAPVYLNENSPQSQRLKMKNGLVPFSTSPVSAFEGKEAILNNQWEYVQKPAQQIQKVDEPKYFERTHLPRTSKPLPLIQPPARLDSKRVSPGSNSSVSPEFVSQPSPRKESLLSSAKSSPDNFQLDDPLPTHSKTMLSNRISFGSEDLFDSVMKSISSFSMDESATNFKKEEVSNSSSIIKEPSPSSLSPPIESSRFSEQASSSSLKDVYSCLIPKTPIDSISNMSSKETLYGSNQWSSSSKVYSNLNINQKVSPTPKYFESTRNTDISLSAYPIATKSDDISTTFETAVNDTMEEVNNSTELTSIYSVPTLRNAVKTVCTPFMDEDEDDEFDIWENEEEDIMEQETFFSSLTPSNKLYVLKIGNSTQLGIYKFDAEHTLHLLMCTENIMWTMLKTLTPNPIGYLAPLILSNSKLLIRNGNIFQLWDRTSKRIISERISKEETLNMLFSLL